MKHADLPKLWHRILKTRVAELADPSSQPEGVLRARLKHIVDLTIIGWSLRKQTSYKSFLTDEALSSLITPSAPPKPTANSWEDDQVERHHTFLRLATVLLKRACDERKIKIAADPNPDIVAAKIRTLGKIRCGVWPKSERGRSSLPLDYFELKIFWILQQAGVFHPRLTFLGYSTHPAYLSRMLAGLEQLLGTKMRAEDLNETK